MNVRKMQAAGLKVGMSVAEVDEDVTLEEMDLDAMDWQKVVNVRFAQGYIVNAELLYHNAKDGTHPVSGTYDQFFYVECDEDGRPIIYEDDWACDYRED